jgi:hypothetical protein
VTPVSHTDIVVKPPGERAPSLEAVWVIGASAWTCLRASLLSLSAAMDSSGGRLQLIWLSASR